ncbi:MAG: bifunctional isocitrate dehydrogenase kinase/phosphatase [Candidatus Promineifilaceae bacterium]|nr:bifunctional isocitrate dehydrogenase kinase/phosphatase [Candidatus Promineifilaceae bacterium]
MTNRLTDSRLAGIGAKTIHQAFSTYREQLDNITGRAKGRFEDQDWKGLQEDAAKRLGLYKRIVDLVEAAVRDLLSDRLHNKLIWAAMKAVYSGLIADNDDWELAETFYNSITRRVFTTVGVDPQIEFVATDFETPPTPSRISIYRTYRQAASTAALVHQIVTDYGFAAQFADLKTDVRLVAIHIEHKLQELGALRSVDRAEMVKSGFYRGMGAYLVGRLFSGPHLIPFALALIHTPQGMVIDGVLLDEDSISILFSFARSYFHVDIKRPFDLVQFLHTIMPRKRVAELYISLGYNKHGKTELYRDLLNHLAYSDDQFEIARGQRGMVMIVFDMPTYDMVFKLIKDRFNYPKDATRKDVMAKYDLVHRHDRAGRLVDAQSFEYLQFDRNRFSPDLLQELADVASETVSINGNQVVVKHAYVERRVTPLDIYVKEAAESAAASAVIDYGCAIKDLANSNIFPGDMLLKNFGVTRHGRVVFYDYDELCFLIDCKFRRIPPAGSYDDELANEPWFHVNERDIFPEEFNHFLGLSGELQMTFHRYHGDLFDVKFWRNTQERLKTGEWVHIFPYSRNRRLHL